MVNWINVNTIVEPISDQIHQMGPTINNHFFWRSPHSKTLLQLTFYEIVTFLFSIFWANQLDSIAKLKNLKKNGIIICGTCILANM